MFWFIWKYELYPQLLPAPTSIVVVSCTRLSTRLSVRPSICPTRTTLALYLFQNCSYQTEIWWNDAQYHEADHCSKWLFLAYLCAIQRTLKFSMIGLDQGWCDVIMGAMASQITSLTSVYLTVYSGADQRKHQNSASLAFVRGIHRWIARNGQ